MQWFDSESIKLGFHYLNNTVAHELYMPGTGEPAKFPMACRSHHVEPLSAEKRVSSKT